MSTLVIKVRQTSKPMPTNYMTSMNFHNHIEYVDLSPGIIFVSSFKWRISCAFLTASHHPSQ